MGDIDFDELDKAVNSLMSGGGPAKKAGSSQQPSPAPAAQQQSQRLSVPARRAAMPTSGTKQANPLLSKDVSKPAVAPVAVRKTGRFMDVVDPTADLNPMKRPMPPTPVRPASSAPKPTDSQPEALAVASPAAPVARETVNDSPSEAVPVRRIAKNEIMPDPLEAMQLATAATPPDTEPVPETADDERPAAAFSGLVQKEEPAVASNLVTEKTDASTSLTDLSKAIQAQLGGSLPTTKPSTSDSTESGTVYGNTADGTDNKLEEDSTDKQTDLTTDTASTNEALSTDSLQGESPFLANARPEKRPLNSPQVAETVENNGIDLATAADYGTSNEAKKQRVSETVTTDNVAKPHDDIHELSHELVKIEATGRMTDDEPVQPTGGSVPLGATTALATSTSISQQYVQKESTGDTSHAPIYDTADYEKTLKHPAKKQSGWWMVLGVLLLLALGSGGAVALYFMGIIP